MTETHTDKNTAAAAIAAELEGWSHIPTEHVAILRRDSDAMEITVGTDFRAKGRYTISQNFHTTAWKDQDGLTHNPTGYGESLPSITVSAKKSATQMARDISRRLLPDCEAFHTVGLARAAGHNVAGDAKAAVAAELGIEASSYPHRRDTAPEYTRTWELEDSPCVYSRVDAKVCGPYGDEDSARVDLELHSITPAQAKAVLAALGLSA